MLVLDKANFNPAQYMQFIRYAAISGFIVAATLLINLNHRVFGKVLGRERAKSLWWFFVLLAVGPLAVILYTFTLIFEKLFPA